MTNPLTALFGELGVMLRPVTDAVTDRDALEFLLYRHGWNVDIADDLYTDLIAASTLAEAIATFLLELDRLDAEDSGDAHDLTALLDASGAVFTIVNQFPDTDVSRLPEPIADRAAWSEFAKAVVGALTADYLALRVPKLYAALVAIGVVENRVVEAQPPFRREHQLQHLQWSRLADFLRDPEDHLRRTYRWGDPAGFDHAGLLAALAGVALSWGFEADLRLGVARHSDARFAGEVVRPLLTESSLRVVLSELNDFDGEAFGVLGLDVIPVTTDADLAHGLLLGPVIDIGGRQQLDLTQSLRLTVTAGAELGANAGLVARPGETRWNAALGAAALQLELAGTGEQPHFLLGSSDTAHVSIAGLHARVRLATSGDNVDADVVVGVRGAGAHKGLHVHVPLDEADGLIGGLVGSDALDLRGAVELGWSNRSGFTFIAGGAIGIDLPIRGEFGPITLLPGRAEVSFAAADGDPSGALRLTAGIRAAVGPIEATATGIGLEIVVRQTSPRLADHDDPPLLLIGEIGLDLGFVPPSGAGLRVLGSVVSGGGFLELDRARGRYAGMLQISVGGVALSASGVIDTKDREGGTLPAPGYSIVIAMSATFPAVQLGLGFTLRGIGGVIGIHRDSDYDALRAGLTTGSLDSVMFPPPGTLPDRAIRDIETLFPVTPGRHVVGPMVLLGWGTPPIADIEVGVLLLFGGPFRVHLLGQLTIRLPAGGADVAPVLLLKLDVVGELDPAGGSLSLDASLRDSSIAGYALTGDMAARVRWNDDPTFAIAFGGFHPDYAVEASFPALRRLALTISRGSGLRIVAESYLAVTSNTVQFGGRAELQATKSGFRVNGWVEFHALFALSPFSFIVAVGFDVSLQFKGRTFASIGLTFELSGPTPWRAKGQLKIKILLVTFRPDFNVSWGLQTALTSPPRPVWPELEAALSDAGNWASVLPPASSRDIIVAPLSEADMLRVHPHGSIEIRQSVVPFGIELRRFGVAPPAGDNLFSLPVLSLGGATAPSTSSVDEPFAPAQFLELTEDERLSRPSFERMPAGIRTGASGTVDDAEARRALTVDHETDLVQPDTVRRPPDRHGIIVGLPENSRIDRMSMASRTRATTEAGSQFRHRNRAPAVTFRPERFAIMETATATAGERTAGSATEAHQAIRRARAAGEARPSPLLVVAVSELS
jgi:hypothetical protein